MTTKNEVEEVELIIKKLTVAYRIHMACLAEIAGLITASAQMGFTHVDSQLIIEICNKAFDELEQLRLGKD